MGLRSSGTLNMIMMSPNRGSGPKHSSECSFSKGSLSESLEEVTGQGRVNGVGSLRLRDAGVESLAVF